MTTNQVKSIYCNRPTFARRVLAHGPWTISWRTSFQQVPQIAMKNLVAPQTCFLSSKFLGQKGAARKLDSEESCFFFFFWGGGRTFFFGRGGKNMSDFFLRGQWNHLPKVLKLKFRRCVDKLFRKWTWFLGWWWWQLSSDLRSNSHFDWGTLEHSNGNRIDVSAEYHQ